MSSQGQLRLWHLPLGVVAVICLVGVGAGGWASAVGDGETLAVVGGLAVQDLAFGAVAVVGCLLATAPLASIGVRRTTLRWTFGMPVVALIGFYALSLLWSLVAGDGEQDTLQLLGVERSDGYLLVAGVLTVVLAPLCEELFFRGFLLECLRSRARDWIAAVIVSAIFASLHYTGPDTLVLLMPLFALSLLLCALRLRSGSLWPAVALHAANNAIAYGATAPRAAPLIAAAGLLGVLATLAIATGAGQDRTPAAARA